MSEQRRLAAIFAADVVGWSRLMGRDEGGTLARLKALRREAIDPRIAERQGRIVKTTGDGLLVEFASIVDAVRCAVEIQQGLADRGVDEAEEARIVLRIGVNLGDIIVDGDDIHGDGVNIAARLEAESPPGGIVISGAVHQAVVGRLKVRFEDLGGLALKNIERPIQAFRVAWDAADWPAAQASPASAPALALRATADAPLALPDKPSIAVLPFQNMSGDPEQEYFSDGMVEDIITGLSRFKSLFVIARNSSFAYKGKSPDIRQVGRELGVRYVLEGSVRKAGGKVRITGQLIDSESGAHLWADRFDGAIEDVFDLQDRVTIAVVGAVAPRLDRAEIERARRKPAENLDAYDLFLRGLPPAHVFSRESFEEALALFYRAIALDPDYPPPYGMAARLRTHLKSQRWTADATRDIAEVERLVARVATIGRDDALALACAGHALGYVCGNYDVGTAMVDQALSINPNLAIGWRSRGMMSTHLGQHEAALEQLARARRLSPLDPETFLLETGVANANLFLGNYAAALAAANAVLAKQPNSSAGMRAAACANALAGNLEEARRVIASLLRFDPGLRLSNIVQTVPYRRAQDIERYLEALRMAGVSE